MNWGGGSTAVVDVEELARKSTPTLLDSKIACFAVFFDLTVAEFELGFPARGTVFSS